MNDAEMQALLSAYAAGTLTDAERDRLFQKALNDQTLFDALADEESMKAALASPLVRKQLLRLLNDLEQKPQPVPPPNRWLWASLATAMVIGLLSVAYWPRQAEKPQIVAMAKPAAVEAEVKPQAPPPAAKSVPPPIKPEEAKPIEKAPEKMPEKAAEVAVADSAIRSNSESRPVAELAPAPAGSVYSFRMEPKATSTGIEVFNGALVVGANASGYLYAFVVDADQIRPVKVSNPVRPGAIPLGEHSNRAEVWFVLTRDEDDVLRRATTGVLPLPTRNWTKVKLN